MFIKPALQKRQLVGQLRENLASDVLQHRLQRFRQHVIGNKARCVLRILDNIQPRSGHALNPTVHPGSPLLHDCQRNRVTPQVRKHRRDQAVIGNRWLPAQQVRHLGKVCFEQGEQLVVGAFNQGNTRLINPQAWQIATHTPHDLVGHLCPRT